MRAHLPIVSILLFATVLFPLQLVGCGDKPSPVKPQPSSSSSSSSSGGTGVCTMDSECSSGNCFLIPFLGDRCGACNEDADCVGITDGGCSAHNPFQKDTSSTCNMGELGGGCETDNVCAAGLTCSNVVDLLGLIKLDSCGNCRSDMDCTGGQICAPIFSVKEWSGLNNCIDANSLLQDSYCALEGNGNAACQSGICSTVDMMGVAQIGACGECNSDADCGGANCQAGTFDSTTGALTGSTCK